MNILAMPTFTARAVFLATLTITAAVASTAGAAAAEPAMPHGAALASWRDNGVGGRYVLQVVQGRGPAPGQTLRGVVTSDRNCMPDAQGLSHCHNGIDLADGRHITVVDNHAMSIHPCLKPGEAIVVGSLDASWVRGVVADRR